MKIVNHEAWMQLLHIYPENSILQSPVECVRQYLCFTEHLTHLPDDFS